MAKKHDYTPNPEIVDRFPSISGNAVNGLHDARKSQPSPFFWHPPERQTHGDLQQFIVGSFRPEGAEDRSFRNPEVDRGPKPEPVAEKKISRTAENWTHEVKEYCLQHEADQVGITPLLDDYVYETYSVPYPNLVIVGVGHIYDQLSQAPATAERQAAFHDLHDQYNRAARSANHLVNYIHAQGYQAKAYPGPMADALNMIPAAIQAGFGELGKHGSLINRQFGSGFRLSAVATDMPLLYDEPDVFGADEFCTNCQVCRNECPPDAIYNEKQMVRGQEKWYVDFDKCIPYFGENYACGICIAVCPWTRPGVADNLLFKMARRKSRLTSTEASLSSSAPEPDGQ
ncbi:MAG: 4Fe-4S dicluster domain-containing protein [Pseudomonadales bacterium]